MKSLFWRWNEEIKLIIIELFEEDIIERIIEEIEIVRIGEEILEDIRREMKEMLIVD